jgi:hypothetical protein
MVQTENHPGEHQVNYGRYITKDGDIRVRSDDSDEVIHMNGG